MEERELTPYDLTDKEVSILEEKGLKARWVREGSGAARDDAHVRNAQRKGWSKISELDRRVDTQHLYVMNKEQHEKHLESKDRRTKEQMALMREESANILDRAASETKGLRPVGYMGDDKDIKFGRPMTYGGKGVKVPVQARKEA